MLSVRVFEVFVDSHWPGSCLLECDNIGKRETIPDLLVSIFCFGKNLVLPFLQAFQIDLPNPMLLYSLNRMGIHEYLRLFMRF